MLGPRIWGMLLLMSRAHGEPRHDLRAPHHEEGGEADGHARKPGGENRCRHVSRPHCLAALRNAIGHLSCAFSAGCMGGRHVFTASVCMMTWAAVGAWTWSDCVTEVARGGSGSARRTHSNRFTRDGSS
jgi:hypothetical protein